MEKVLDVARVFGINTTSINLVLIPVVIVVIAVAVFVIGLKKPDRPKFRNSVNDNKNSTGTTNGITKKKKRSTPIHQTKVPTKAEEIIKKKINPDAKVQVKKSEVIPKKIKAITSKDTFAKNKVDKKQATEVHRAIVADIADGLEWQTVIAKKKQKVKQSEEKSPIPLTQEVNVKKDKKKKENANKNTNSQTSDLSKPVEKTNSKPKVTKEIVVEQKNHTTADVESVPPTTIVESHIDETITPIQQHIQTTIVFDELGDDGWMETKPAKKNKKRALRE